MEEGREGSEAEEWGWWEWGLWREGGCPSLTHSRFPEVDMDSTDEPIDLDPGLTVSGGSAIALLLAGSAGLVVVMIGIGSAIAQTQRYRLSLTHVPGLTSPLSSKTKQNASSQGALGSFREDGTDP